VCQGNIIERNHLPLSLQGGFPSQPTEETYSFDRGIASSEKAIILDMLQKNNWNKGKTASALNINRTTLWRKMKKYSISV
jgi:transcriptional regulator with PAS, ATPase and Fis domain